MVIVVVVVVAVLMEFDVSFGDNGSIYDNSVMTITAMVLEVRVARS